MVCKLKNIYCRALCWKAQPLSEVHSLIPAVAPVSLLKIINSFLWFFSPVTDTFLDNLDGMIIWAQILLSLWVPFTFTKYSRRETNVYTFVNGDFLFLWIMIFKKLVLKKKSKTYPFCRSGVSRCSLKHSHGNTKSYLPAECHIVPFMPLLKFPEEHYAEDSCDCPSLNSFLIMQQLGRFSSCCPTSEKSHSDPFW